jgi:hypothetical protein
LLPGSAPVRLRISYRSPESLLQAFTKSVGRGACRCRVSGRWAGTRFLFELTAESVTHPVEVLGEWWTTALGLGEYLNIQPGRSRRG